MLFKNNINAVNDTLKVLPDSPGVYMYFDEAGTIIYVGKAKSLKKRVAQYFNKDVSGKTKVMVGKIADLKTIVVNTEADALLLENNLIKEHKPRYNILLKDDKTYPWLCIKNENFPRVFKTRNKVDDGSEYFGPYASVRILNTLIDLIAKIYPLRTCRHALTDDNIKKRKYSLCLKYHINRCLGPCVGLQSAEDYNVALKHVRDIITGKLSTVIKNLEIDMYEFADKLEFEKAQIVKEKIELLRQYKSKSLVTSTIVGDVDVFSIASDDTMAFVNYMKIVEGSLVHVNTIEMKKIIDEQSDDLLMTAISELRMRYNSESEMIIVPFMPSIQNENVKYIVPKTGDKKHLLELSERNLRFYILEREKRKDLVDPERHTKRILNTMMHDLRMPVEPRRIECFDNSNLQGTEPVAAMVCFIDAKPAKREYRHFNIKTVVGPDDFASMEEVIFRRYKRVLDEGLELPQLIIVDGGKGQLSSALKSLEALGLDKKITVIGIAKRLEELYYPGDSLPMYLNKNSETLKIIQQLRDDAHRFGITHHRNRRSKAMLKGGESKKKK
ncbi:MAG: excinuclease ABC subunit UvrC [Bacteroidales bacterium]|nr:excinuclease ABC subunit UvrC [Bacteroidales bacterium]